MMTPVHDPLVRDQSWQGRRVGVAGLGRSGCAAARLLLGRGASVIAFDDRERGRLVDGALLDESRYEALHLGSVQDAVAHVEGLDALVVSPGIGSDHLLLLAAHEASVPVLGEVELATRVIDGPVIAITGTNGKSTTASLVHHCLLELGLRARLAGNIGVAVCEIAEGMSSDEIAVLELSSFQLETIRDFRADVCALLNLAPDHLDRYDGMEGYAAAKRRMLENADADSRFVFAAGENYGEAWASTSPARALRFGDASAEGDAVWDAGGAVYRRLDGQVDRVLEVSDLKLVGAHNLQNVCAAIAILAPFELDAGDLGRAICSYSGLRHRSELVFEDSELRIVNDSKATNVHAATASLRGLAAPVLALFGGSSKSEDFAPLATAAAALRLAICYGEEGERIAAALAGVVDVERCESLAAALEKVQALALPGDCILLSPACASFDEFQSFEERGDRFRSWAQEWGNAR